MAGWGTVTVGGIAFREDLSVEEAGDGNLRMRGQESHPPQTHAAVKAAHANVIGLRDFIGPVTFSDKLELNGFYEVTDASSVFYQYAGTSQISATWEMTLRRIGSERDVEMESRVPTIGRADELAGTQVPSFWHAPPPAVASYYTGLTVPGGSASRPSEEGTVTAYTALPADVAPRWTVPAAGYMNASSRLLIDGIRRAGAKTTPGGATWEVSNGIIKVGSSGNGFAVSVWSGAWESLKAYLPAVAGANLAVFPELTILRNEPGEVGIRLTYPTTPGRVTVDLSLRRGARFVTGVIKRHSAATLGIRRTAAEASTLQTGGMMATAADADGNRALMLSSRLLGTTDTATPYISKASVTSFDFAIGFEVGSPAGTGNTFAELLLQYLGTTGDRTRVIER